MSTNAESIKTTGVFKRWYAPLATSKLWLQTAHLLFDLPIGIIGFTAVVTFVSLSGGLVVTLIGIPLLAATVLMGRLIATVERGRSKNFLGDNPPQPAAFNFKNPSLNTMWAALKDVEGWKGILYGVLLMPLGIFNFCVVVVLWSVTIGFSFASLSTLWLQRGHTGDSGFYWVTAHDHYFIGSNSTNIAVAIGLTIIGLFLFGVTPRVINGLATLDRMLIRALCSPSTKGLLNQRVNALEESRSASVQGAATELRRIERNLHDGAQQHLVSVAMQLGLAKERINDQTDPQIAELVTSAHKDAKQAIVDLRDLVRGIHPAVLADRGLDAAVSALAARSPIPVDVNNEVHRTLPTQVEATAYFVIGESLTNIAKHSQASEASVRLSEENERLVIEVKDNGIGGAHNVPEGGLSGLRDRVRSIDGDMTISSPAHGPTRITVTLPCA